LVDEIEVSENKEALIVLTGTVAVALNSGTEGFLEVSNVELEFGYSNDRKTKVPTTTSSSVIMAARTLPCLTIVVTSQRAINNSLLCRRINHLGISVENLEF